MGQNGLIFYFRNDIAVISIKVYCVVNDEKDR